MDADLVKGNLGTVGKFDVAFKDGALVAELDAAVSVGSAGLVLKIEAGKVLDALAAAIPGTIDDAIINIAKGALGVK